MKRLFYLLLILSFGSGYAQENIRLNQLGFLPNARKVAVIVNTDVTNFTLLKSQDNTIVYTGTLSASKHWDKSDENVRIADFSDFTMRGKFKLQLSNGNTSYPFDISDEAMHSTSMASLKAFYFNRASIALEETFAGVYKRAAGHPDNQVIVLPSAASTNRPAGTVISTPKGWYDAGDYNKYIVNSGISVFTLLAAYENYGGYYDSLEVNIPETGNGIPDILNEALWNIEWMGTMQDPDDGGVYNKTTHANFDGVVMPNQSTAKRYVVAKGTAAALDFAAVMAMASRIYKTYLPEKSAEWLTQAEKAWDWAKQNSNVPFNNPGASGSYPAVNTGGYGDGTFTDEFFWAASELFITTQKETYLTQLNFNLSFDIPGWPNVQTLGILSLSLHPTGLKTADSTKVFNTLTNLANNLSSKAGSSPYLIPNNDFYWGSNSVPGNQGVILMRAYEITRKEEYYHAALSALDYLLGRNAIGYCFVTGLGSKSPQKIHHRQSGADNISAPVPGFLSGGPNPYNTDDCGNNYPSTLPAKCWKDDFCSYSTNEVTINWNAPLVYLSGALEASYLRDFYTPDTTTYEPVVLNQPTLKKALVYPNPATDWIRVKLADDQEPLLTLTSMNGATILQRSGTEINICEVPAGIYILTVSGKQTNEKHLITIR